MRGFRDSTSTAIRRAITEQSPVELVALAAIAATPVALFLDYRAHTDFVARIVMYLPVGEDAGRPVPYVQIWGLTQATWLVAAVAVLIFGGWQRFVQNVQFVLLSLGLAVLVIASAVHGGVDSTTVLNVGATLVPYLAMIAVLGHPLIRPRTARDLVTIACASGAVVVALTIAKKAIEGALHQRLQTFAFGTPPETGVVLAPLLLLVPAMSVRRSLKITTAVSLASGLILTQTRGGAIAAFAGAIVLIAAGNRRLRLPALAAVGVAAVAYVTLSRRSLIFTDLATSYRRQNTGLHWHLFVSRPVLGYGISYGSLPDVRAAHNTFLTVADAGGIILVTLWVAAWILLPLSAALVRWRRIRTAPIGAAAIVAVVVGWSTTGSDVFDYTSPTNLVPLMLGVALIGPVAVEGWPKKARILSPRVVGVIAGAGLATATVVAALGLTGVIPGTDHSISTSLRARALVAAREMAFSSCGACNVTSIRQVAPDIVEARLGRVHNAIPSSCFFVAPLEYHPRSPGVLPPGIGWSGCVGGATSVNDSARDWVKAPKSVAPGARIRARAAAEEWLARRCSDACRITTLSPLTSTIWRVTTTPRSLQPSPCFYVLVDEPSLADRTVVSASTAAVSCDL